MEVYSVLYGPGTVDEGPSSVISLSSQSLSCPCLWRDLKFSVPSISPGSNSNNVSNREPLERPPCVLPWMSADSTRCRNELRFVFVSSALVIHQPSCSASSAALPHLRSGVFTGTLFCDREICSITWFPIKDLFFS